MIQSISYYKLLAFKEFSNAYNNYVRTLSYKIWPIDYFFLKAQIIYFTHTHIIIQILYLIKV